MSTIIEKIHNFEAWVKAAAACGLHGPTRVQGFDTHHFVDDSGKTVAVWHGAEGHGTVPAEPPAPVTAPSEPEPPVLEVPAATETTGEGDVQNHSE